jgi:hypothetical protein
MRGKKARVLFYDNAFGACFPDLKSNIQVSDCWRQGAGEKNKSFVL